MTYMFTVDALSKTKDIASAVMEAGNDEIDYLSDDEAKEAMREHVRAISTAVEHLKDRIGEEGDYLEVSVTGHANPDHGHRDGWADEQITITVKVVNGG